MSAFSFCTSYWCDGEIPTAPQLAGAQSVDVAALFYLMAILAYRAHRDLHAVTAINLLLVALLFVSRYTSGAE